MHGYDVIENPGSPIKAWTRGVPIEDAALTQLKNVASLDRKSTRLNSSH